MATPLKRRIEETFAQAIMDFAGVSGQQVDPDLEERQLLQSYRTGILLMTDDYKAGPLICLKARGLTKIEDSDGGGAEGRSMILRGVLRIEGISQYSESYEQTVLDRDVLEEVIRFNLLKTDLGQLAGDYDFGGKKGYVAELNYLDNYFEEEVVPGERSAPVIEQPIPATANTSSGLIVVDTSKAYMASMRNTYTVQIISGTATPGSLSGVTWAWRKGNSGPYSTPQPATSSYQPLADGVQIKFVLGNSQTLVTGDRWTIQASPNGHDFVAFFWQEWEVICETTTGF